MLDAFFKTTLKNILFLLIESQVTAWVGEQMLNQSQAVIYSDWCLIFVTDCLCPSQVPPPLPCHIPGSIFPITPTAIWSMATLRLHFPYCPSLPALKKGWGIWGGHFFCVILLYLQHLELYPVHSLYSTNIYQINDWIHVYILKTHLALLLRKTSGSCQDIYLTFCISGLLAIKIIPTLPCCITSCEFIPMFIV